MLTSGGVSSQLSPVAGINPGGMLTWSTKVPVVAPVPETTMPIPSLAEVGV